MKRFYVWLWIATLVFSFSGCGSNRQDNAANIHFYYLRSEDSYVYGEADGVVTYEERDSSAQSVSTSYLLSLYLMGPLDESLRSPFPPGCKVTNLIVKDKELSVVLNSNFTTLTDMSQTLACVCLARTCMSVTGAETIHIYAESFSGQTSHIETISLSALILEDSVVSTENPS